LKTEFLKEQKKWKAVGKAERTLLKVEEKGRVKMEVD
jgi:hypothetical protein